MRVTPKSGNRFSDKVTRKKKWLGLFDKRGGDGTWMRHTHFPLPAKRGRDKEKLTHAARR